MSLFREAIAELYLFGLLHAAIFTFGFGLVPPAQTSYGPPAECAAPFSMYQSIGLLDFFLVMGIVAATYLAGDVRYQVSAAADGMAGVAAGSKASLRLQMLAAVLFSAASMAIALAVTVQVLQIKHSVLPCWSATIRGFAAGSLAIVAVVCARVYARLVRVALYSE